MSYNFKKIGDLELLNVKPDGASVVIETEGAVKRLQADKVGVTSWNDLKDKPFGETTVKGDTLTWDGNTEGLVSTDDFSEILGTLYKISDAVPTLEDCISGATYTVAFDGKQENRSIGYDKIAEMSGFMGCLCIVDLNVLIAPENNFQIEVEGVTAIFPEAGLYTAVGGDCILKSLTIPGYNGFETTTIIPIDTKYLPEALQFGETVVKSSTLTWDGNTEGLAVLDVGDGTLFYRVSDTPPALADFANGCHVECGNVINGFAYKDIEAHVQQSGMFYGESWVYLPQDASGAGMTVAKGIYFMNSAESGYVTSLTIPGYNGFETTTIKPLDEKYLPESVKGDAPTTFIINSDTHTIYLEDSTTEASSKDIDRAMARGAIYFYSLTDDNKYNAFELEHGNSGYCIFVITKNGYIKVNTVDYESAPS